MTWRVRRQLIVLLIAAIPFAALGLWAFSKFLPAPTCTDNTKNQKELGVDCGGPCGPCELKNPKPLTLFWARVVPAKEGVYDVAAEIQNENEVLSSANLEYEFTLSDDFGPVAFRKGKTYVFAQERLHVIEANIPTVRMPTRVSFKVTNVGWEFRREPKPNIVVEKRDFKVDESQGRKQSIIDTTLVNRTSVHFTKVEVLAIVLDKEGNLLGANRVVVEGLPAASRKEARLLWPAEISGDVALVIVEPRVNIFDPNSVFRP